MTDHLKAQVQEGTRLTVVATPETQTSVYKLENQTLQAHAVLDRSPANPDAVRFKIALAINGKTYVVETETLSIADMKYVSVAREHLSEALRNAVTDAVSKVIEDPVTELARILRGYQ